MMIGALVDNDVMIKVAAYQLGSALVRATTLHGVPPAMLSVGRFVARDRLSRAGRIADAAAALACFEALLPKLLLLEPTDEELAAAADFETAAAKLNLELDGGESQLLAMLLVRTGDILITGDKRAIVAIASIAADAATGKVACFEQLVATLLLQSNSETVRAAVCREPLVDKSTTICCNCHDVVAPVSADILAALGSYINDVRKRSEGVLFDKNNLLALAA